MSVRSVTPPNEWTRRGVDHCIQNPGEGRALEARILRESGFELARARCRVAAQVNARTVRPARGTVQRKF